MRRPVITRTQSAPPVTATTTAPERRKPVYRAARFSKVDREFLPAALEILETPASPVGMALILIICAFVVIALAWSYFGRVDIVAVAQGKLQPAGRVKTLQALETSRVLLVGVQNGAHVKAGDILVRLDPRDARADQAAAFSELAAHKAEVLRRETAIGFARSGAVAPFPSIDWPQSIPAAIRTNEDQVLRSDLAQLSAQTASLQAQAGQKRAEQARLSSTMAIEATLVETLQERVNMRSILISQGAGSKANLLDSIEALQRGKAELARDSGQLAEAEANLAVIAKDMQKSLDTFVADNAQKYSEAQRQVATLGEKLVRAEVRTELTTLTSPIDGTIQASTVTTAGQVVTPGEELMRIVPDGATLEVECYLPNKDVGFVQEGQSAIVKLEAFPFTTYGFLKAEVVRVAHDAIPESEAQQTEQNLSRQKGGELRGGAQRVQNLVYPVTLRLEKTTIGVDGTAVPLQAGMAASVEIRTGSRRIISYVMSPLTEIGSEALRER